jgi:hypothetical protein
MKLSASCENNLVFLDLAAARLPQASFTPLLFVLFVGAAKLCKGKIPDAKAASGAPAPESSSLTYRNALL